MKLSIKAGTTSKLLDTFIQDSSSTTGAGLTGLAFNSGSLTGYYYREGAGSAVSITLATMTLGTWATGGFIVIDGTNMPGSYQLGIPDAALAAGAKSVLVMYKGASNMAPLVLEVELTAVDNQSVTAFITGVNSLAPPTNWNLEVIDGSGRLDISKISGTSQTARDLGASVLLSSGVGAGQISLNAGTVTVGTNNDKTGYSLVAGQIFIKKNTQITITFPMTDSTTHLPVTGLTVTAKRTIDGAAIGLCANAVTELTLGVYSLVLAAADVNGAMITLVLTAPAADSRFIGLVTQA